MYCEKEDCIYEQEGRCLLEKITITSAGLYSECIRVRISESFRESMKKRQRKLYGNRDK